MNVLDLFNPYSAEHLLAYDRLCRSGAWPKGFFPKQLEEESYLQIGAIQAKMAKAWLQHASEGHVVGCPAFERARVSPSK